MKPKPFFFTLAGCGILAASVLLPRESAGQVDAFDPQLQALLTEVAAQQAIIAENQTKIDEKVNSISEEVRVARIFVGRAGGKAK